MSNSTALVFGGNTGLTAPSYLTNNAALDGASATVTSLESLPTVKMDKGQLWLVEGGKKVDRKSLIVENGGVKERITDVLDMVIAGYTDVLYAYFTPGQELGAGAPLCFSVGGRAPHAAVSKRQGTTCKTCPRNQEGTGQNGKGKACGKKRMAIGYDYHDPERKLFALQIPTLSNYFNPPGDTGMFGFEGYLTELNRHGQPVYNMVTRVTLGEDERGNARMNMRPVAFVDETTAAYNATNAVADGVKHFRAHFEYENLSATTAPMHAAAHVAAQHAAPVAQTSTFASLRADNPALANMTDAQMATLFPDLVPAPAVNPYDALRAANPALANMTDAQMAMLFNAAPAAPAVQPAAPAVQPAAPAVQPAAPVVQPAPADARNVLEGTLMPPQTASTPVAVTAAASADAVAAAAAFIANL